MRHPNGQTRMARRGTTAVEFAVVLPVFIAILLFFFELQRFQQVQHAVNHAALEAGRIAITPGATANNVRNRAVGILNSINAHQHEVVITPATITETTHAVTIDVTVPYAQVGLFFRLFGGGSQLTASLTWPTENSRVGRL